MDPVDECNKCIHGKETVLVVMDAYFQNLTTVIFQMTGSVGLVDRVNLLRIVSQGYLVAMASGADGMNVVNNQIIPSFLKTAQCQP